MEKKIPASGLLRTITLTVITVGAIGSLFYVMNAGRNNNSALLRALFGIWVLSPFIAFLFSYVIFKRWLIFTRASLYYLMLFIAVGSLLFYSGTINLSKTKPAFIFLIVPLISWALIIITLIVQRLAKKNIKSS